MNKLISFLVAALFSVISFASAEEFKSITFSNAIRDIAGDSANVYFATEGGIVVINKATGTRSYHQTTVNNLPGNSVSSLAVSARGIWATGGLDWVSFLPKGSTTWEDKYAKLASGNGPITYDLVARGNITWAAMVDGLYFDTNGTWREKGLLHDVQQMAIGDSGELWMINASLIALLKNNIDRVWIVGADLIAGRPFGIAVSGDSVVVPAESGFYLKVGNSPWTVYAWPMVNIGYYTTRGIPIPVAIFKGKIYFGTSESVVAVNSPTAWADIVPGGILSSGKVNCLYADKEKLYIGTSGGIVTYDGKSLGYEHGSIAKPHTNNIVQIASDNTGLMLVSGSYSGETYGGYHYENNANSPSLNSSQQNVYGEVRGSFVDKDGVEWLDRFNYFERKGITISLPTGYGYPYYLVGDIERNPWLVATSLSGAGISVFSYAGQGTWGNQLNAPANLAREKLLSVSSNGNYMSARRLWIATDSALYSYNFVSNWTYRKLGYSPVRQIAGDNITNDGVWIADQSLVGVYGRLSDVKFIDLNNPSFSAPSWPYQGRVPTSIYVDYVSNVWVTTDSGVYFIDRASGSSSWQAVPLRNSNGHTLADDYVNTVCVYPTTNAVWFGTAGGLTVWHRSTSTSVKPVINPSMKAPSILSGKDVAYFDISGRRINPSNLNTLARGQIIFRRVNGVTEKINLNFTRLR
jgi:hypothetical protein